MDISLWEPADFFLKTDILEYKKLKYLSVFFINYVFILNLNVKLELVSDF